MYIYLILFHTFIDSLRCSLKNSIYSYYIEPLFSITSVTSNTRFIAMKSTILTLLTSVLYWTNKIRQSNSQR